jgi:hypothetical protein
VMLREVLAAVKEIEEHVGDHEQAHRLEDRLYKDVLAAIAADPKAPGTTARLAKAALETQHLNFKRWYA